MLVVHGAHTVLSVVARSTSIDSHMHACCALMLVHTLLVYIPCSFRTNAAVAPVAAAVQQADSGTGLTTALAAVVLSMATRLSDLDSTAAARAQAADDRVSAEPLLVKLSCLKLSVL